MSLRSEISHTRRASSESALLLETSTKFAEKEKKHMTITTALAKCQEGEIGPRRASQPKENIPMKWQFDEIYRIQEEYKKSGRDMGEYQISNEGRHYRTLSHPASYPKLSQTAKHQELRHRHSSSELNALKRRPSHNYYYGSRSVINPFPHLSMGAYDPYMIDSDEMQKNRYDELDLELELLCTPRSAASMFSSSSLSPVVFSPQPLTPISSSSPCYSPSTPYSALFPTTDNEEYLRMHFPLDEERWQLLVQQQLENSLVGSGSYKPNISPLPMHEATSKPSTPSYMNDIYASTHMNSGNLAMDQIPRTLPKEQCFTQLRSSSQDPIGTRTRKSDASELPLPTDSSSQTGFSFFSRSPTTSFNKASMSLNMDKSVISDDGRFSPFRSYSPVPLGSGEDYFSTSRNKSSSVRQKFDREGNVESFSRNPIYSSSVREREQETLRAGNGLYTSRQPLQRFDDGWDTYELRMDMDRTQHARNFARSEMIPRRPRYCSSRTTVQDPALIRRSSESQINSVYQRLNDNVETFDRAEPADFSAHAESFGSKGEWRFHNGYNTFMNKNKMDVTRNGLALGVI
uniref:THO complex subunit HPR1 n=1 Tax=Anthurium amnicola TaxID=1678845 RepID=A0A1D1ZI89_9ARAE